MAIWKLMLATLGSGALFGTIGGTAIHPTLKPPPEQPWRQGLGPQVPITALAVVDTGPEDLSPQGFTYGAAHAFPGESARPTARRLGFRYDDQALQPAADDGWNYAASNEDEPVRASEAAPVADEMPAVEAAEAARDAAQDAADQGLDAAPAAQPVI